MAKSIGSKASKMRLEAQAEAQLNHRDQKRRRTVPNKALRDQAHHPKTAHNQIVGKVVQAAKGQQAQRTDHCLQAGIQQGYKDPNSQ